MKATDFLVTKINDRLICLRGVGRQFDEEGFPISMAVSLFKSKNIEVSILHVADELLKIGWNKKTVLNKLKADFEDDADGQKIDVVQLEHFIYSDYDTQRKLIYKYLFDGNEN